jgi:hypothetical protein
VRLLLAATLAFSLFAAPAPPAYAADSPSSYPPSYPNDDAVKDSGVPIEWQKVGLQEKIAAKLQGVISGIVPAQKFVLSVDVELKEKPKAPAPDPAAPPGAKAAPNSEDDHVNLGKLDMDAPMVGADADADNLFKNIAKLKVGILLDSSVSDTKRAVVEKVVKSVAGPLAPVEAEIAVDKADLFEKEKWDAQQWFLELRGPIGVLIATLLACAFFTFLGLRLLRGYTAMENRKIAVMEAQNTRDDAAAQAARAKEEAAALGDVKGETAATGEEGLKIEGSRSGFDKFRALLKEAPEKGAALVRQWIKTPVRGATEGLQVLPRILGTDEFLSIFQFLSLEDRKVWKKVLGQGALDQAGVAAADDFISSQIVDTLLVPAPAIDEELGKALAGLQLSECVELATQDVALGAILVNVMPTVQVGRMFALMPPELANSVTVASLKYSDEELRSRGESLKAAITALKGREKHGAIPFLEKANELFEHVGPDKESSIFSALADSGELKLLETAARQFFPAELMLKLPAKLLKACLERLPLNRRADLLLSRPDDERNLLLDTLGKQGSKIRDLIDVEMQQAQSDDLRKKRIEKTRDAMWKELLSLVRASVRGSEAAAEQAEGVLGEWLSDKTGGKLGGAADAPAA